VLNAVANGARVEICVQRRERHDARAAINPITELRREVAMLTIHTLNDRICPHSDNAAHGIEVPSNPRLLFCNGQVGARLDGTVAKDPPEQIDIIFDRIRIILAAADMSFENVVKLTVYVTDKSILGDFHRIRRTIMGSHNPPATLLVVKEFPRPGVEVEIEAVAAKV
jgi:2-iminobutanoate/2-iminopropanoate deaminase